MSGLALLQRDFMRALLDDAPAAEPGIEVYREGVRASRTAALAATYPVVRRLVGDAFFAESARRYAALHPSASGDLNEYGASFAAFLAAYEHAASLPYLADVAALEWACHECERAAEPAAFDFAALAGVAREDHAGLRFTLHPAVRLVASPHAIVSIHAANAPERDGTPEKARGAERALVWRAGGQARVERCAQDEWRLLQGFARGETLARASDGVAEAVVPQALARWVSCGVISAFAAPPCAR
jgi:hypothetical protein